MLSIYLSILYMYIYVPKFAKLAKCESRNITPGTNSKAPALPFG